MLGIDLNPPKLSATGDPIVRANAVCDALPQADVAYSMHLGHHLSENDLIDLIRNVGRSCRRFILLDLVRHPMPLILFRIFLAPLVCRIVALDGKTSIRRSYTPIELYHLTAKAMRNTRGVFQQSVAPIYSRQVIDIRYSS